jgi:hypothetical protein
MAKVLQDSVEEIASVNPNKIVESDLKVKEMWEKVNNLYNNSDSNNKNNKL